jgi:hypothetical protein
MPLTLAFAPGGKGVGVEGAMRKSLVITSVALGFLVLGAIGLILAQKGALMAPQSRSNVHAPEFPAGLQWLNTDQPLTIAGLRGKVVLLDFWTYCCINCMHVIPELKTLEKTKSPPSPLAFPGKVLADEAAGRLCIADSNHHRIMIADLQGNVLDVAGAGQEGHADGAFAEATFNHPQGMALDGPYLYVADTENHLIRRLDLQHRVVETLLGTGQQARQFNISGIGRAVAINSPWDVVVVGRQLYIAMAGFHQVWVLNLGTMEAQPFAGSGREDIVDGQRLEAAMAQPSGFATDGKTLYVVDSETSSIRAVDLGFIGTMQTIIGEGLFEFGDQDGTDPQVRLQHPLGVAQQQERLYVADTYNHKIKIIYPHLKTSQTYLGSGRAGSMDGALAEFYEPGGLSIAGDKLYIADINNHAIRVADLASGEVSTLKLAGLVIADAVAGFAGMAWMDGEAINMPLQTIRAGTEGRLVINFELPPGYKLNPAAPMSYAVYVHGAGIQVPNSGRPLSAHAIEFPLTLSFQTSPGSHRAELDVEATFYWCREDNTGVCMIHSARWHVPLETSETVENRVLTVSTTAQLLDQAGPAFSPPAPLDFKGDGSR